jgi:hypothetical protein
VFFNCATRRRWRGRSTAAMSKAGFGGMGLLVRRLVQFVRKPRDLCFLAGGR